MHTSVQRFLYFQLEYCLNAANCNRRKIQMLDNYFDNWLSQALSMQSQAFPFWNINQSFLSLAITIKAHSEHERKRTFSLMFAGYSLIFFAFASVFVWCDPKVKKATVFFYAIFNSSELEAMTTSLEFFSLKLKSSLKPINCKWNQKEITLTDGLFHVTSVHELGMSSSE